MHYPFEAGLILDPPEYQTQPLVPESGLSELDKDRVQFFYPELYDEDHLELIPLRSVPLKLEPGEQINFIFEPPKRVNTPFRRLVNQTL